MFERLTRWFNRRSLFVRTFIYIVILGLYFTIGVKVLKDLIKLLFTKEFINPYSPLIGIFLYFIVFAAIIALLRIGVQDVLYTLVRQKRPRFRNEYLVWTIVIILFVVGLGLLFIREMFLSVLPIHLIFEENHNYSVSTLDCFSNMGFDFIVVGDDLKCKTNIFSKRNNTFENISYLQFYLIYWDEYHNFSSRYISPDYALSNYSLNISNLFIPIIGKSKTFFGLTIGFYNAKGDPINIRTQLYGYFYPMSVEEYETRNKNKLTYLLGLFSLALFSILSAMRNLKDIIEKRK